MDCARCEELLFARLDGAPIDPEREVLEAHLSTCDRCRRLHGLLCDSAAAEAGPLEVPDDLVPAVLARTSQPVARALVRLRAELPALAEIDPGEAFLDDVLAATVGARGTALSRLVARVRGACQRLARRPRLALEGAYAAMLFAFLVFGLPAPSVAELPARAYDGVRQEAARIERAVSTRVDALVGLGVASWTDSSSRAAEYLGRRAAGADTERLDERLRTRVDGARQVAAAIWQRLFAPFFDHLRAAWQALRADDPATTHNG